MQRLQPTESCASSRPPLPDVPCPHSAALRTPAGGDAKKARRTPSRAFRGLDSFDDLKPGDLLVHRDYGIGRFAGLEHMSGNGIANDFLLLDYAGQDKLYVPVDRMGLVQRFKGGDADPPALDRLGGSPVTAEEAKTLLAGKAPGASAGDIALREERSDGRTRYEGEFYGDGIKYEFELDAATGVIYDWNADLRE